MTANKSTKKTAPETEEVPVEVNKDVEILAAEPGVVELSSGSVVRVNPMKTRELLKLLKIFTVGAGALISEVSFNTEDEEAFTGQLIGLLINAIPEAEDETIDFILSMVTPVDLIEKPRTKEQRAHNDALVRDLYEELGNNPELEDSLDIIVAIIERETPNMLALGKRLTALFGRLTN